MNGLEERLSNAGDDYTSYAEVMARAGHVNVFDLLAEAAQLALIKQMLDTRFPWTADCDTTAGRVEAVLNFAELRMVEEVER